MDKRNSFAFRGYGGNNPFFVTNCYCTVVTPVPDRGVIPKSIPGNFSKPLGRDLKNQSVQISTGVTVIQFIKLDQHFRELIHGILLEVTI